MASEEDKKEYHRIYNLTRYHQRRARYIEQLGGKCVDCGTTKNLEFDHIVAEDKSIEIGDLLNYSEGRVQTELKKCALRCKRCHQKKSVTVGDIRSVEHGGGLSGKKNCPCIPCKTRKREYMQRYNASRK